MLDRCDRPIRVPSDIGMRPMKACVLEAIGRLTYTDVAQPIVPEGWCLVKVAACGVCGSDLPRIFTKGTYAFPTIPGHEFSGTVVSAPESAQALNGRLVSVFPLIPCRRCGPCSAGLIHLCADYDYMGSRRDGAFAEYVAAPLPNLLPVPQDVDAESAAMAEPAAVALHALRRAGLDAGDTVWVIGSGPIGVLVARWAVILGARVLVSDIDPSKLTLARDWAGADVLDASAHDAVEWVMKNTGGTGADLCVDAVGVPAASAQALRGCRPRGSVVWLGNPSGDMTFTQADYWLILRKELKVTGSWNSEYGAFPKCEWSTVLQAMASRQLDPRPLITHRANLAQLPALLQRIHSGQERATKIMTIPERGE